MIFVVLVAVSLTIPTLSFAAEQRMTGMLEKITVQDSTATVILKDTRSGKLVTVVVKDQLAVDKLKDKRIVVGDEIRIKYDDTNMETKLFRKTSGC